MAQYLARSWPRCAVYRGIEPREPGRDTPLGFVGAHSRKCNYRLAWIVIWGERGASPANRKSDLSSAMGSSRSARPRSMRARCRAFFLAVAAVLAAAATQQFVKVQRVIDGDTIMLESGEGVQLIGVDTPETVQPKKPIERFAKEAASFTRRMVQGKRVRLEYDQANTDRGHKEDAQQGRTLAYVFLEDGTLLNAEIIRLGYGFAFTRFPFSRMEEFLRLERAARTNRRGLWSDKP